MGVEGQRPPLLPLFLIGFLALAGLASIGAIPAALLPFLREASRMCLLVAIVALGMKIAPRRLLAFGPRPLLAIVGQTDSECPDVWTGSRYITAASQTGGFAGDICESSWNTMLEVMGLTATGIRTMFQLSEGAVANTIVVTVDEDEVGESDVNGWTYDRLTRYLEFHGDAVPPRDSLIFVTYTIDSGYVASTN